MAPSPVVARWELSRRLATRRRELRVEVKAVTDALGFTRNYWSAVENDRTLIADDKLRLLFDVLAFDEAEQAELLELRERARAKGWWDQFSSLTEPAKRFYGMEFGADRIRLYEGHFFPGILQIESYARAVLGANPGFSAVEVDRAAAVRRERQRQLLETDPPAIKVLLSEAALRQQVAGPEVQVAQLRHVANEVSYGAVPWLRILPFSSNAGTLLSSPSLLFFEYDNPRLTDTVWQEGVQVMGDVDADDEPYRYLDLAWRYAEERALEPDDSLRLLDQVCRHLEATRG